MKLKRIKARALALLQRARKERALAHVPDTAGAALSDRDTDRIAGGLVGLDTAGQMACMAHEAQAYDRKLETMRKRGYSEEVINQYIAGRNNPGKKVVLNPIAIDRGD